MRNFKFFGKNEIKWRSYGGLMHPLSSIHTSYIKKLMRHMAGLGEGDVPNQNDGRTNEQWYFIFADELKRRREEI